MLFKKVVYVTQFVSDQDKALDFYTRLLDFEKRVDIPTPDGGPRFLTVGVSRRRLSARALAGEDPGKASRYKAACRQRARSRRRIAGRRSRN